LIAELQGEI
jgi:hypothetical protein